MDIRMAYLGVGLIMGFFGAMLLVVIMLDDAKSNDSFDPWDDWENGR